MATLALTAIGGALVPASTAAIGGVAAGAVVGGIIGSVLDQAVVFPAIFGDGSQAFSGPRLDDLQLQTASEGSPAKFCLGPENRIAGTVIWIGRLEEVARKVKSGGKGGALGKSKAGYQYFYFNSFAVAWCEGPIEAVEKVWADGKLIYDLGVEDSRYDSITHYLGTNTQTADSVIQADPDTPSGDVPGYRGTAYTVFERLALLDWGNRIPQMTALIRAQGGLTLAQGVTLLVDRAGVTDAIPVDVSRLDGCLRGYTLNGPTEPAAALEPILMAFNVAVQEVNGTLVFFHRGDQDAYVIETDDLPSYEENDDPPSRPISLIDRDRRQLPDSVTVRHTDPEADWQQGSQEHQKARKSVPGSTNTPRSERIEVPVVISAEKARALAKRLLWTPTVENPRIVLQLSPDYIHIREADILTFTVEGFSYRMRVTRIVRGANNLLEVEGVVQQDQIYAGLVEVADTTAFTPSGTPFLPQDLMWQIMNIPALTAEDAELPGVYFATGRLSNARSFSGGELFVSIDSTNGVNGTWRSVGALIEAPIGRTLTALAAPNHIGVFDPDSTVEVLFATDTTLSTITKDQALAGRSNLIVVGDEVLIFQTATLVSARRYTLSNLIRGVRGTQDKMSRHFPGDRVVLLEEDTVGRHKSTVRDLYNGPYYKAVPSGAEVSSVTGRKESDLFPVRSFFPIPPNPIKATRFSTSIRLEWKRRMQQPLTLFLPGDAGSRWTTNYRVQILHKTKNAWEDTADANTEEVTIPSTSWTTRGYGANDTIPMRIAQKAGASAAGPWTTFLVPRSRPLYYPSTDLVEGL